MSGRHFRLIRGIGAVVALLGLGLGMAPTAASEEGWDPTLPKLLSAGAPGDPVAVAQASLAFTQQAAQATMDLGRKFLSGLGIGGGSGPAALPGGRVRGPQAVEYVIARGGSQRGVPYSWGGGAINGHWLGRDHRQARRAAAPYGRVRQPPLAPRGGHYGGCLQFKTLIQEVAIHGQGCRN